MKKTIKPGSVVIVLLAVIVTAGFVAYYKGALQPFGIYRPSNALMVIAPYQYAGTWVFDDPAVGLSREPFVSGTPEIIDEMVQDIPDAEEGFRLLFSTQSFPGYTHKLTWRRGDKSGNWYYCEQTDQERLAVTSQGHSLIAACRACARTARPTRQSPR